MEAIDALIIKVTISRCFLKMILVDIGSSVDIILLSALRQMKFNEEKIERIILNLVGFNREPSIVVGRVFMPISTQRKTIYSAMMVVDTEST